MSLIPLLGIEVIPYQYVQACKARSSENVVGKVIEVVDIKFSRVREKCRCHKSVKVAIGKAERERGGISKVGEDGKVDLKRQIKKGSRSERSNGRCHR